VQTVGAIVTVAAGVLYGAVRNRRVTPEVVALAAGTAASLGAIDVVYVARGRIRETYLLDAAIEAVFIAGMARRR
jgi:hypothetical protein